MSSASVSCDSLTYAFFWPSGLMRVLILSTLTSYSFLTASAIWCLLARTSQIKVSVLYASIFFIDDSVPNGCLITANWSNLFSLSIDLRAYFGLRASFSVLGKRNLVEVTILRFTTPNVPFCTAFLACSACLEGATATKY